MRLRKHELEAWRAHARAAIGSPWFLEALRVTGWDAERVCATFADGLISEERGRLERPKPATPAADGTLECPGDSAQEPA